MDDIQLLDEVEQNIVICQWRADQLFADAEGRDTDKSRYFAITEFNNCFIIHYFISEILSGPRGRRGNTQVQQSP